MDAFSYDFGQDGSKEGSYLEFMIVNPWSCHHQEEEFRSCEIQLQKEEVA